MSCSWEKGTTLYLSNAPGCVTAPLRLEELEYTLSAEKAPSVVQMGLAEIDTCQAIASAPTAERRNAA